MYGIAIAITIITVLLWCVVSLVRDLRRAWQKLDDLQNQKEKEVSRGPVPGAIEHVITTTGSPAV
jgi:hypothetical protein